MGVYREVLEKRCKQCGMAMERVSLKSPYIDASEDGCPNVFCSRHIDALRLLEGQERMVAAGEAMAYRHTCDRDYGNEEGA